MHLSVFPKALCAIFLSASFAWADEIPCDLDPLFAVPTNWEMTPDDFEKQFTAEKNRLFVWLTADRSRAKLSRNLYRNREIKLTAFAGKVPTQEAIVDFADGKLNVVSLSMFNRGDEGDISPEVFKERFTAGGKAMSQALGTSPKAKKADSKSGLITAGYSWYSQKAGSALLEHNDEALLGGDCEFLRLRLARPNAKGPLAAAMLHSRGGGAVNSGELVKNVTKNQKGDVFLTNVPMVDQGDKGYCVVATAQRVFEYFGIGADMHQIAQITNADPSKGTNTLTMAKELGRIDHRFQTRLSIIGMADDSGLLTEVEKKRDEYYVGKEVDQTKFLKEIRTQIDRGLPLLWSLELGIYPEEPLLNPQTQGGHMRLIIGYNDKEQKIIFSDSWGAGHEAKKMKMPDAYKASRGLFVLKPTIN